MITENKNQENESNFRGLENDVPQNHGLSQDQEDRESNNNSDDNFSNHVNKGGAETIKLDPQLEEQWLAVRDEYRSHYPDLNDRDTEYEKGSFYTLIDSLAKKRKRTAQEIQHEIMDWSR